MAAFHAGQRSNGAVDLGVRGQRDPVKLQLVLVEAAPFVDGEGHVAAGAGEDGVFRADAMEAGVERKRAAEDVLDDLQEETAKR